MAIRLYCFGESGNAYKAALTLQLAGMDWQPVYVDFFNGGAKTDEFLALNPMGEVPVMECGDLVLAQSGIIQRYVIEQTGRFGGNSPEDDREIWRWVLWDNHKLSSLNGICRFLNNFLPEEKRPREVIGWLQGRLTNSYSVLENRLQQSDWLVGDQLTVADISCCGYLYYPEPFGFDPKDWPAVGRWLDRLASQPHWKHPYDLMPGHPSDRGIIIGDQ
ncbi:MAG: glutathione S-transferase family protein [Rhodobacteraceae bacterium]|nr:glutathione S-transferase family protein [Paracoccaceae bacterium]MCY4326522.1 glutathione S-transferase family protein [Paracoccaceae bacterium]